MKRLVTLFAFGAGFLTSGIAVAAEQTVKLAVSNMYCAACPSTVKKALSAVPGVTKADVSFKDKSAVVTFDDQTTTVDTLIAAATNAGYPTKLAAAAAPVTK
ncbi:MAG: mercury resistance system periplasmic binding protein MerP [Hyphomicrobiaceae bacterium]|nr:MAG: mercury resistance system periplasmic binding protein MerP [Hyphomicrobiaceae bacterium]